MIPFRVLSKNNMRGDNVVFQEPINGLLGVLELVPLRSEKKIKLRPQTTILVPLSISL